MELSGELCLEMTSLHLLNSAGHTGRKLLGQSGAGSQSERGSLALPMKPDLSSQMKAGHFRVLGEAELSAGPHPKFLIVVGGKNAGDQSRLAQMKSLPKTNLLFKSPIWGHIRDRTYILVTVIFTFRKLLSASAHHILGSKELL